MRASMRVLVRVLCRYVEWCLPRAARADRGRMVCSAPHRHTLIACARLGAYRCISASRQINLLCRGAGRLSTILDGSLISPLFDI